MSMDRIHDVPGLMQFAAQPVVGSTGTASTVASLQFPGGYNFGGAAGFAPAATGSLGGGAPVLVPFPRGVSSTVQTFATTGLISHDNAGVVLLSVSTTGVALNLQPPAFHGQLLTIVNLGTTGSIVSTVNTTGVNGTTTAACPVLDAALTFASTCSPAFIGLANLGGTATSNLPVVWKRVSFS